MSCSHSPWCEEDQVCRCDQWEEYEQEQKKADSEFDFFRAILLGFGIIAAVIVVIVLANK